jgi:hypothetical protein
MNEEIINKPGNTCPPYYHGSLEREFRQLQNALMGLTSELYQTGELIQTINDYINEKHVIHLPLHEGPVPGVCGRQKETICG